MSEQVPQNSDDISVVLAQTAQRVEAAFQGFLKTYARTNPPPNVGVFAKLGAVSVICLMLVEASSTAIAFTAATYLELQKYFGTWDQTALGVLAFAIGVIAVAGIEGFIITAGMKEGMTQDDQKLNDKRFLVSIILLFASCVANFCCQIGLINNDEISNIIAQAVSFGSGFGMPISFYFIAPYLKKLLKFQRFDDEEWLARAWTEFRRSKDE